MRLNKADIVVAVILVAILCAAGFIHDGLSQLAVTAYGSQIGRDDGLRWRHDAALACLAFAALVVLFLLFPMIRAQHREQGKLHALADALRQRSQALERAAFTDVMTGLFNRRYFDEALAEFLAAFGRLGRPVGLLLLDLDHFKRINDTHGHDVGDDVLRAVSRCLLDFTRSHDVVARLGGEEFAVVVPDMNHADLAAFADRLRQAVERLGIDVGNVRLRITMSVGLAVALPEEDAPSFTKRADVNLYAAKQSGRNRICA